MNKNSRNFSLRELRSFCVAVETGSFRGASEKLFITASAVSHQIKNLEETLGGRLFERGVRTLTLSNMGESLYRDLAPLIGQIDDTVARHTAIDVRTALSISVQPFFASEVFVPRLPEFRVRHPHIDILIDTSDESPEKHPARADVSIRVFRSAPDKLYSRKLFPLRLVPVGTQQFRKTMRVTNGQITSEFPIIVHATRPQAWQDWQRRSRIRLPTSTPAVHADSMIAVARAAEKGLGAALVPLHLSDAWIRSGSLVRLFDQELTTDDAFYFVCRNEDADDQNVRLLRDWVFQEFDSLA